MLCPLTGRGVLLVDPGLGVSTECQPWRVLSPTWAALRPEACGGAYLHLGCPLALRHGVVGAPSSPLGPRLWVGLARG